MICNFFEIDDIHGFAVIYARVQSYTEWVSILRSLSKTKRTPYGVLFVLPERFELERGAINKGLATEKGLAFPKNFNLY